MATAQILQPDSALASGHAAMMDRYLEEREKRINKAGLDQYVDFRSPDIQDLAKDPWVESSDSRVQHPPLKDGSTVRFLISGGGHNGLLYAARLIEAGFSNKDIVVVDIAAGFGGTWYWNRYPGLMCDIEGYCYLPLLEETGYVPKHKYSYGDEIRGHNERAAKHFGVQAQFCTKVESQTWDEDKKHWVVTMTRTFGDYSKSVPLKVYANFVILAGGVLAIPKIPKLPGWADFRKKKHAFHSSRWDYDYTGGTQEEPDLINLKGKSIAIIGTGATSVQIVPELAKWADRVYVVQRTPSYCGWRNQTLTDKENWKTSIATQKGWQNTRRVNFNAYISNSPGYGPNVVDDGWTHTPAGSGLLGSSSKIVLPEDVEQHIEDLYELDESRTDLLRKRIEDVVADKDTVEKLKPYYGSWCKRPTFHDEYLEAFNKPNVTLIDTDGKGLEAFSERGILFGGKEYEIDAVVLATGFISGNTQDPSEKLGATITGRNGETLSEKWPKPEAGALFGIATTHFPNLFGNLIRGGAASWNLTSTHDIQARLFAHIAKTAHERAKEGQKVVISVSQEAEENWSQEVAKRAPWYESMAQCTPGYFNSEGAALKAPIPPPEESASKARKVGWASGPVDFQKRMETWAAKGDLQGFSVEVSD